MKSSACAPILFLLSALCVASAATPASVNPRVHIAHYDNVLGTSLDLKIHASSEAKAARAEVAALAEFDREDAILSAWSPDSEFSHWLLTRNTAVPVSPELFEVLALFDVWRERTGGALDASAEAAVRVWKLAAAEGRMPAQAELATAVREMQRPHWRLDPAHRTATHLDDVPLALNSFAKSYVAGRAADAAVAAGASAILLNAGGDIVLRGNVTEPVTVANPRADAENDPPLDWLALANRAIATSGSYRRGVEIGGEHFSHIVDPRTADAVDNVLSSTVVAESPAEAGALATAFSVMTPAESRSLASRLGNVEYLLLLRDGQKIASPGWSRLEMPHLRNAVYERSGPAGGVASAPETKFDLLITLELARIDDPRYRRPYVAVWVEDSAHQPIRTIALWSARPRYLSDLRNWYRTHPLGTMSGGEVSPTISSATRPPGKYTLRWDGLDDAGKPVKPGKYTVWVEAAREHGTYQVTHLEIDFDGRTPAQFDAPAGTEMAAIKMEYGRHAVPAADAR